MHLISIVIPSYNESQHIGKCLRSLVNQSIPRHRYQIILVDGGSRDATREIASRYADLVMIQRSPGVAGARHDGILAANSEIVATTDADTLVNPRWVEKILENLSDPEVVGVCGPTFPREPWIRAWIFRIIVELITRILYRLGLTGTPGTNTGFRKGAYLDCGGYRNLRICDDAELGLRLRIRGKLKYDWSNPVFSSTRRQESKGYLKTLLEWMVGDLMILMKRNPRAILGVY